MPVLAFFFNYHTPILRLIVLAVFTLLDANVDT